MAIEKDKTIKQFPIPEGNKDHGDANSTDLYPLPPVANRYNASTNTLCYNIGDIGPGGGIIFGIPGTPGMVPADEYWEMTMTDLSDVDEPVWHYGMGGAASTTSPSPINTGSAYHPITGTCSNHPGGAEWGLFGVPGYNGPSNMSWGEGKNNTDAAYAADTSTYSSNLSINPNGDSACFPWQPCSPKSDTRLPAFRIAKDYNGGGYNDWFLPSFAEWLVALYMVGPMQGNTYQHYNKLHLDLVGNDGVSPVHYWTSSAFGITNSTFQTWFPDGLDTAAVVIEADQSSFGFQQSLRCFTRRVRAVRKFTCTTQPPCTGPACIDYNFRDGNCGRTPGSFCGQSGGGLFTSAGAVYSGGGNYGSAYNTAGQAGVAQNPVCNDSVIGGQWLGFAIAQKDVKGHTITKAMWQDDSQGYTITVWDADHTYLGKWHYAGCSTAGNDTIVGLTGFYTRGVTLNTPTHLDGPYPVIDYSRNQCCSCGSVSGAYFKIEMAALDNDPNYVYENGVNETWLGNPSSTTYPNFCMNHFPQICTYSPSYNTNICYPWYATYDPTNCCIVYPTASDCQATGTNQGGQCNGGGTMLAPPTGSSAKLGQTFDLSRETGNEELDSITDVEINMPKTESDNLKMIKRKRAADRRREKNKKFKKK